MSQALPAACVGLVEQAQFVLITVMVESIGSSQLAAHSGMLNIFQLMTCGMYGLSDAGASTVGRLLGKGLASESKRAAKILLNLMMCMSLVVAGGFIGTHSFIGRIFTNDPAVLAYTESLALILSAAYVLLSLTFSCFGTLQGQGRPHVAAMCMFVGLWGLSVPLAWVLGIRMGEGLVGVWWGLVVGYSFMTVCMVGVVVRSDWVELSKKARERSEKEKGGEEGEEIREGGEEGVLRDEEERIQ
jgi:MATE family multidrug resistance protein